MLLTVPNHKACEHLDCSEITLNRENFCPAFLERWLLVMHKEQRWSLYYFPIFFLFPYQKGGLMEDSEKE